VDPGVQRDLPGLALVEAIPVFGRLRGRMFEAEKWDVELAYKNRTLTTRLSRLRASMSELVAPPRRSTGRRPTRDPGVTAS